MNLAHYETSCTAGSILMGLDGYLSGSSDVQHYDVERAREEHEVQEIPEAEAKEVSGILRSFGLARQEADKVMDVLRQDLQKWVDFMMRFELGLEEPDRRRAL